VCDLDAYDSRAVCCKENCKALDSHWRTKQINLLVRVPERLPKFLVRGLGLSICVFTQSLASMADVGEGGAFQNIFAAGH
jgi:hypothetical protein